VPEAGAISDAISASPRWVPGQVPGTPGPAVQAGRESRTRVVDYFKQFDTGRTVSAIVGPPEIKGRFFYSENYQDFNFGPRSISVGTALDTLLALAEEPQPPAIALQAMNALDIMPSFLGDNTMPLLDRDIVPRVWMGNRSMIATHFDNYHNIACVVSGSRRFTVFPPEQVGSLYIGPLLKTPGGSPISVVDLSGLPAVQRQVWRTFFDHFAFQTDGDPGAHLPSGLRDVMGDLSPADRDQVMAFIAERLKVAVGRKAG